MKDRRESLRDAEFQPVFGKPARTFLNFTVALILAGSTAFLIALYVFLPEQTGRALGPVGTALVGLAAWYLLWRRRIQHAIYVLAFGFWGIATVIAAFNGGMSNMAVLYYPLVILLLGWMAGMRSAIAAAMLSTAAVVCFALAESYGVLPVPGHTPPAIRLIVQSLVYVFSAILIVYFVRSYQDRLNEAIELDRDLNRAQAVAHVGSWVYDLARDHMRLSAETCRIFGLPEGTTGSHDSYLSRVHPEDRDRVDRAWQTALKGGLPFDDEHRILLGDTVRWIRQRAELEFRADGTLLRGIGTTQDITEIRVAQSALRESEARFRVLFEGAPDAIVLADPQSGNVLDANQAACRMLGRAREQIVGMRQEELHPPRPDDYTKETFKRHVRESQETGHTHPIENVVLSADGSRIPVEILAQMIRLQGQPVLMGIFRDITERKRNEDEYRTIIQASLDGFWITDFTGRILDTNDAACRALGYTRDELLRLSIRDIDADETTPEIAAHTQELVAAGGGRFQARHRRKDGAVIDVEVSVLQVPALGERLFAFVRDITKSKRAEAARIEIESQLRESQKMEALGTLAGGVAHDFNNIVAAIIGNVELARQDVGPAHPALESLEEIRKASRRARELVQQILAFGRRQVLERKVISLAPAIDESARLLRSTLPAGIELTVECAPDAPPVLADATQIEQVLLNLCSNAWQAMQGRQPHGAIGIRLAAHSVSGAPYLGPERRARGARTALSPGRYACLSVSDNGPGMDQATRSRIFEPFFTTKPVGEGTGLGLAVVHGIVHDHEASISVQSVPGEGATFRIYFPAAPSGDAESKQRAAERNAALESGGQPVVLQGEGKHVLYLDDDEAIVFLMTRLLQRQGYRVSGYTDAGEALAAVRARPKEYDLVVTDYNMPDTSGLEVARALREIRADLPVALASGYITEELRQQAPAAGVRELIYKPETVEGFCQTVARLINKLEDR